MTVWAGVDVGGPRKGFHVAVVGGDRLLALERAEGAADVVAAVERCALTAVDSPRMTALAGQSARECERMLAREICGIRWTPDAETVLGGNPYYEWIRRGLALYRALAAAALEAIECFPTASWTRWGGRRGKHSRARWSARVLAQQGLADVPGRLNQDWRDAIGAALTARAHSQGLTQELGEIVVPL